MLPKIVCVFYIYVFNVLSDVCFPSCTNLFYKELLGKSGKKRTSIKQPQYAQFKHMMTSDIQYTCILYYGRQNLSV